VSHVLSVFRDEGQEEKSPNNSQITEAWETAPLAREIPPIELTALILRLFSKRRLPRIRGSVDFVALQVSKPAKYICTRRGCSTVVLIRSSVMGHGNVTHNSVMAWADRDGFDGHRNSKGYYSLLAVPTKCHSGHPLNLSSSDAHLQLEPSGGHSSSDTVTTGLEEKLPLLRVLVSTLLCFGAT
jgi:hypothetical protein